MFNLHLHIELTVCCKYQQSIFLILILDHLTVYLHMHIHIHHRLVCIYVSICVYIDVCIVFFKVFHHVQCGPSGLDGPMGRGAMG